MDLVKLKEDLIRHEGLRLKPYYCPAGKLTIGVGRNLEDNGISEEEARILLDADIKRVVQECQITFSFWPKLNNPRKIVLLNMVFNMGMTRVYGFKKMMMALDRCDFDRAASEMLSSKWAAQVRRRAAELAEVMRSGSFPDPD